MFKRALHRAIVCALLSLSSAAMAAEEFASIVIFGDSLSDNGNLADFPEAAFLRNPLLPYDLGFSNGPRAVEVLAEALGLPAEPSLHLTSPIGPLGSNFAVARARAVTLGMPPSVDLPTQVNAFLLSRSGHAPPDALYVVFIGGNDIFDARDAADAASAKAITKQAVSGVELTLRTLADAGAVHFLLVNAPDIGAVPETRQIARAIGDRKFVKRATKLTRSFNKKLRKAARRVERKHDVEIIYFDAFRLFRHIVRNRDKLGFTNTADACFSTAALLNTGVPLFHPDCKDGLEFDSFIFFDEIHPTARVHRLLGEAMAQLFEDDDSDDSDDSSHDSHSGSWR